jgi:hypothetical protein
VLSAPSDQPPPRPADEGALGFERKSMVSWFDPAILFDSALRVVLSSAFGAFSDKREMQAAIDQPPYDYAAGGDGALWIDFVADLADGFDSTYAIASLLARPSLELADGSGAPGLPRGRVLVMGGDQVYASPTREDYENRFRGPYGAALPWAPEGSGPDLFAIPGNHDWYDGLTNFVRFFCAGRRIGGWQTRQHRSYFALRLPHNWWLLGLDIQLDTYIDDPQMDYFRGVGLAEGDRVILVTGKPSWVKVRADEVPESYKNLQYFEEKVVRAAKANVEVTLTGDLHHYCRFEDDAKNQLITAGGGGAYLFPTHTMPCRLELPGEALTRYRQAGRWPPVDRSRRMAWGALRMPVLAKRFCLLIALLQASFAITLFIGLDGHPGVFALAALIGLLTLGGLVVYAAFEWLGGRLLAGLLHTAFQLAPAAATALVAELALDANGAWATLAVGVAAGLIGYLAGGLIFGLYLVLSHRRAPKHANDVFACQGIPDFKNFLRLRIDEDGLTIHPIGIERVPREWAYAPDAEPADPWLKPADGPLQAKLIEDPISIPAT